MSSTNTGMQRAVELSVEKTIGGEMVSGYPHLYRITDSFSDKLAVSEEELASMPISEYKKRLAAFKAYVESVEIGLTVNTSSAYTENLTSCPI
nr:MAG TPA: hypothetical protein [Caudoviricetes sp.]